MPRAAVLKRDKPSTKSSSNGKLDRKTTAKPKAVKPEPVEDEEDWEDEDVDGEEDIDEMEVDEDGEGDWDVEEEGEDGFGEEGEDAGAEEKGEGGEGDDDEKPAKKIKTEEDLEKDRQSRADQKKLLQERKAHKPNAQLIQRAKKLWEHLRQKKLKPEDRQKYMEELMGMVEGKAKDVSLCGIWKVKWYFGG